MGSLCGQGLTQWCAGGCRGGLRPVRTHVPLRNAACLPTAAAAEPTRCTECSAVSIAGEGRALGNKRSPGGAHACIVDRRPTPSARPPAIPPPPTHPQHSHFTHTVVYAHEPAPHPPALCPQVGMHFMHPVPRVPLVELAKGLHTSHQTYEAARSLAEHLGKSVCVAQDRPASAGPLRVGGEGGRGGGGLCTQPGV